MSKPLQQIKNILVPTDFSPASWEATLHALELCQQHQAKMTLFHVVPGRNGSQAKQAAHMSKKLQSLTQRLNKNEEDVILAVTRSGKITSEISRELNNTSYDLVVMGVNGNGGLNADLGTNARLIVEESAVPVRVVPNKPNHN